MTVVDAFYLVSRQVPRPVANRQRHVMGAVNTPPGCRIPVTTGAQFTF